MIVQASKSTLLKTITAKIMLERFNQQFMVEKMSLSLHVLSISTRNGIVMLSLLILINISLQ